MAIVFGMHLDRVKDYIGSSLISGFVNSEGRLILTSHDGTDIDAGIVNTEYSGGFNPDAVVNAVINGSGELVLTQHDGSTINLGVVGGGSSEEHTHDLPYITLGPTEPVPAGTPDGMLIFRTE